MWVLLALALTLLASGNADAEEHRSKAALNAFQHTHPCPSTGLTKPIRVRTGKLTPGGRPAYHLVRCPGYVIDHVDPLCHGGRDTPGNMQWQRIADARRKDRWEK